MTIGGKVGTGCFVGCAGGLSFGASSGLVVAEGRNLPTTFPFGDWDCGLWKPPKEPKDPETRFEKLLLLAWAVEDLLLDTVDCDLRCKAATKALDLRHAALQLGVD